MSTIDHWVTRVLDRLFEKECIQHDGTPVMYRWILARRGHGAGIYIHHFVMSDGREMHDHPKPFTTVGLKGGYREASAEPGDLKHIRHTEYRAPWMRRFPPHHIHRVILEPDKTCWTLAIVGAKSRPWGFFVPADQERWHDHPWGDHAHRHRWVNAEDFHRLRTSAERAEDPETPVGYILPTGKRPGRPNGRGVAEPADAMEIEESEQDRTDRDQRFDRGLG